MTHGLILFAHGARDPRWAQPFEAVAARLAALVPHARTRLAYLELMSPGLAEAVGGLAAEGCMRITVVPMFLGAGGHVRRDLPELLSQLRSAYPHLEITLTAPIGEMPTMLDAMAQTIAQALAPRPHA